MNVETPNLVNFVLMSLTLLYLTVNHASFILKAHLLWNVCMKSFLVTNIEWENPTALVTCTVVILTRVDMHPGQ